MIDSFRGNYRFLSNFYPVQFEWEGEKWPSVEHAYQAAKCRDKQQRTLFLQGTAGEAKRLGRRVEVREDWEEVKLPIMEALLRIKFAGGASLADKLLATGEEELQEGNTWGDRFWGTCNGEGQNHLGKLLMKIRKEQA